MVNKQRLAKYSARTLLWRPISITIAIISQAAFYIWFYPLFAHDPWFAAIINTLFINSVIIPAALGFEYLWHWVKHKLFPEYKPGDPNHEHVYKFKGGMTCDCGKPIEESPAYYSGTSMG